MIGFPRRAALDVGTANTLVFVKGRGVAVNEPSLVTVRTSSGGIEAAGGEAADGLGRTPRKFRVVRPIRNGAVSDPTLFEGMLHRFLEKARLTGPFWRLEVAAAVPGGREGEAGRRLLVSLLEQAGAVRVLPVEEVAAAAWGAGFAPDEPRARMLASIGAGATHIAIVSRGRLLSVRTLPTAGDEMDAAIADFVAGERQLLIGEGTAERLKTRIGSALPGAGDRSLRVKGRCLTRGVPREIEVREAEVREALSKPLDRIVAAIRETLEEAPPGARADIRETGLELAGGSALLRGLDRRVGRGCAVPARVAHEPLTCVIRGLAQLLGRRRFEHST